MAAAGVLCTAALIIMAGSTAFAEETKTLKVAMECNYAPYNWTQSTDENGAAPVMDSTEYVYGYLAKAGIVCGAFIFSSLSGEWLVKR